jgi:hypothetical protein
MSDSTRLESKGAFAHVLEETEGVVAMPAASLVLVNADI